MRQITARVDGEKLFQSAPAIAGGRCARRARRSMRLGWFQSAPAIAGGRCPRGRRCRRTAPCFNPRPPLLAGDAGLQVERAQAPEVSIRARHCWRAMPVVIPSNDSLAAFQSAPAIAGGRCPAAGAAGAARHCFNPRPPLLAGDAAHHVPLASLFVVSIRARHCWRAMPRTGEPAAPSRTFQSAPAIAGGRCFGPER